LGGEAIPLLVSTLKIASPRVGTDGESVLKLHDVTRPQLRASAGTRALARGLATTAEGVAAQRYLLQPRGFQSWTPLLKACLNTG
jgi:hypothetical protein